MHENHPFNTIFLHHEGKRVHGEQAGDLGGWEGRGSEIYANAQNGTGGRGKPVGG